MRSVDERDLLLSVEEGYTTVPIEAEQANGDVRVCVIFRMATDPASGHFVLLRALPQASVLLGALTDAKGQILEWLELWFQSTDEKQNPATWHDSQTNALLDREWLGFVENIRALDPGAMIGTRAESHPPHPGFIHIKNRMPFDLIEPESKKRWELCRDDALLTGAGLPSFSMSRHRYLFVPGSGESGTFIAVTSEAPHNQRVIELPLDGNYVPFNPACGLYLVRRFSPLGLEEYADLLGSKPWSGIENARKPYRLSGVYRLLEDEDLLRCGTTHLFAGPNGRWGRFAESLHLKLQLITQLFRLVKEHTKQLHTPLLNISASSFRISMGATGFGLPALWTGKASLVIPSQAYALPIHNSQTAYFQKKGPAAASIYQPEALGIPRTGLCNFRIKKTLPASADGIVFEGTCSTREKISVAQNDLISVTLPLQIGKVQLFGYFDETQARAQGEFFFRTIPQNYLEKTLKALRDAEGVPFNQVEFSAMPPLSSPCDLYSLGVIAVQILLASANHTLPSALDAVLSLAKQVANEFDASQPLGSRIQRIIDSDTRWLEALGPRHLVSWDITSDDAIANLPQSLWWDVLGVVIRLFPGVGPDSFCKDFGDAPALALDSTFEHPLHELENLTIRSRSLILLDWKNYLEIANIIHSFAENLS